tara:strand:- start:689 stop:805 length:117 start_codon:yes stop_codon:yes gene_type:complete
MIVDGSPAQTTKTTNNIKDKATKKVASNIKTTLLNLDF